MAGVEIREGFLCPICVQDLGSVIQLQDHFELVHAGEDRAVLNQLKGYQLILLFLVSWLWLARCSPFSHLMFRTVPLGTLQLNESMVPCIY